MASLNDAWCKKNEMLVLRIPRRCEGELVHGGEEKNEGRDSGEDGEKKVCRGQCAWGGGGLASGETEEVQPFIYT